MSARCTVAACSAPLPVKPGPPSTAHGFAILWALWLRQNAPRALCRVRTGGSWENEVRYMLRCTGEVHAEVSYMLR